MTPEEVDRQRGGGAAVTQSLNYGLCSRAHRGRMQSGPEVRQHPRACRKTNRQFSADTEGPTTPMSVHASASDDNTWHADIAPYTPRVIPTSYRGYRFRSRLEARWAVFFDRMDIGWTYEPEGFVIGGRAYLPDFLLECGSWVEVKGYEGGLNKTLMRQAALALPKMPASGERGPNLLVLGPLPEPYTPVVEMHGDWGHMGISPDGRGSELLYGSYGFGNFHKNSRPWWFDERDGSGKWLQAQFDEWEPDTSADYAAANSARFEHGQSGAL